MSKNFNKIGKSETKLLKTVLTHISHQLSSPELASAFLNNLLTEKERLTIARRLLIASMIQRGETYMEINEKLSVSPNTFTKIKKWLESELPNYNSVIEHTTKATRERSLSKAKYRKDLVIHFHLRDLNIVILDISYYLP